MASIIKIGDKWRAQIRRKPPPTITRTFDKKALAERWAQQVEIDVRNGGFADDRRLAEFTTGALITKYEEEVGKLRPIGRNKAGALDMLKRHLGETSLARWDEAAVLDYAKKRAKTGAGAVVGFALKARPEKARQVSSGKTR